MWFGDDAGLGDGRVSPGSASFPRGDATQVGLPKVAAGSPGSTFPSQSPIILDTLGKVASSPLVLDLVNWLIPVLLILLTVSNRYVKSSQTVCPHVY